MKEAYWIWLSKTKQFDYHRKLQLVKDSVNPIDLFYAYSNQQEEKLLESAFQIVEKHSKLGIRTLTPDDELYRSGMPMAVYYLGRPYIGKTVAIVGTRNISAEGFYYTRAVVKDYVDSGFAINSGLAYGVDIRAHREALELKGLTQAFVAHGLDKCYPKEHHATFAEIARAGCIYSEYEAGVTARQYRFLERNRLMASMSNEVVVIEAGERSGALNTARHALELGKKTITIKGPADSMKCAGNHWLEEAGTELYKVKEISFEYSNLQLLKILRGQSMTLNQIQMVQSADINELNRRLLELEYQHWVKYTADGKWHYNGW